MRVLICAAFVIAFMTAYVTAQETSGAPRTVAPSIHAEQLARLERAEAKLKDWPNLGRYRDANSKLAPPAKDEHRVVFLGDSITDSWKLNEFFPSRRYINRGISGQTTPQMLVRFRTDVIALRPKVVVILAGTNDLAGNTGPTTVEAIQDNLQTMAELARIHGIRVVIASVLPINDYSKNREGAPVTRSTSRPPEMIAFINNWIKGYTQQNGLVYLDYYSATVDEKGFLKQELSSDGLHPNQKGYEAMQPLAQAAIENALRSKLKKIK